MSGSDSGHWSEDAYWTGALDRFIAYRDGGNDELMVSIAAVERAIFSEGGPGYRLFEALCAIRDDEGEQWDGYRSVPRLCLAFLKILQELSEPYRSAEGEDRA